MMMTIAIVVLRPYFKSLIFFPFRTPPKLHGTTDDTPDEFLLILKRTTISCNPPSKYKVMLTLSYQFTEGLQKKAVNTTPTITNHIDFN